MKMKLKGLNIIQFVVRLLSGLMIAGWAFPGLMSEFSKTAVRGNDEWSPYAFAIFQATLQMILTWIFVKIKATPGEQAEDEDLISMVPCVIPLFFPMGRQFLGIIVALTGIVDVGQAFGIWKPVLKKIKGFLLGLFGLRSKSPEVRTSVTETPPPARVPDTKRASRVGNTSSKTRKAEVVEETPGFKAAPLEDELETPISFTIEDSAIGARVLDEILIPAGVNLQAMERDENNRFYFYVPSDRVAKVVLDLKAMGGVSDIRVNS